MRKMRQESVWTLRGVHVNENSRCEEAQAKHSDTSFLDDDECTKRMDQIGQCCFGVGNVQSTPL